MKLLNFKRVIYILFLFIIIFMSICFRFTRGLVTNCENSQATYVIDYYSSGSDDIIVIESSFLLYIIPLFISLLRITKIFKVWEYVASLIAFILQCFLLLALELGSITATVIHDHNYVLLVWCISLLGAFIMLHLMLLTNVKDFFDKRHIKNKN